MVWEHVTAQPAAPLRPSIRRYVGYRMDDFAPGVHRGLPAPSLTLIVAFDAPLHLERLPDPSQPAGRFWTVASGLHATPALIRHDGSQHGVQLELTPVGARRLYGLPAGALASTVVPLDELLGGVTVELTDRLAAAASWPARFGILDEVLTRALRPPSDPGTEVAQAWQRLIGTGGTATVRAVADEVGWSRRHLSERFQAEYGLTPKLAARVARFDRARRLLMGPKRPSLADVAARCGYADQAHLTRNWHDFAGGSPTAWLADEGLPFVQDGTDDGDGG